MKKKITYYTKSIRLVCFAWIVTSCSLDIDNINEPTDAEILTSRDGLITLSVGMRQIYSANALEAIILTPGTTARELRGITTFTNIIEIDQGGSELPNFNGNITAVWQRPLRVMGMADDIIANAPNVLASEPSMLSGVLAHAKLMKAMCLGGIAQSFTHGILQTSKSVPSDFVPRERLLEQAVLLLEEARTSVETTPPSSDFTTRVTGTEFDLINTIHAYRARYYLMLGNYEEAIEAAESVDLSVASRFTFTVLAPNPLYQQVQVSKNFAARDNFGLPPSLVDPGDKRLDFYFNSAPGDFAGDPVEELTGFAAAIDAPIPAYLPDEMLLIIAESIVRSDGNLPNAIVAINAVRTQSSGDPFGVHADLAPYAGGITPDALLTEIYKQRSSELYLSGLRLEDNRRFGRPAPPQNVTPVPITAERSRNFYPFPLQERQNNPNTPADPEI